MFLSAKCIANKSFETSRSPGLAPVIFLNDKVYRKSMLQGITSAWPAKPCHQVKR
jgi:hypothetical protein